jgi:uncharacterized membrane protein
MVTSTTFEFLYSLPGPLATMLVAMIPFAEAQVAVPMALSVYKISPLWTIICSGIGGTLITTFLVYSLGPIIGAIMRYVPPSRPAIDWLMERTRHRFVGKYEKYGLLALLIFVIIPGPGSGAWAGSLAAFLFGIPKKKAIISISVGLFFAAFLVLLVTTGVIELWRFFN